MPNATIVNFAGGETSPKSRGRFDIASYNSSCRKLVNFISEVSGPARFRPGFEFLSSTRGSKAARIIPFQFNDGQSYLLEFTPGKMRVRRNGGLLTTHRTTITGVTVGSTTVVALTSATGLADGDEVSIADVVGATWLNGRRFKLAGKIDLTFRLTDPDTDVDIVSTGLAAWSSGGKVGEVYEIDAPYGVDNLAGLQFAQTLTSMYLTCYGVPPYKLTPNTSTGVWTLATYSRTNDPITVVAGDIAVEGVDQVAGHIATYSPVTAAAILLSTEPNPDLAYTFAGVVGATELNTGRYKLQQATALYHYYPRPYNLSYYLLPIPGWYWLVVPETGAYVDSSGWGAWSSDGTGTADAEYPVSCGFYEGRFLFGGTNSRPRTLLLSMAPDGATGDSRFDTFTGGTAADDACFFSLSPVNGTVDYIAWVGGTAKYLLAGTFGGVFRVSGGGVEEPITTSSVNVRQIDTFGCEPVMPALSSSQAFFIQRGGKTLRGIQYDLASDGMSSVDMCLNADQMGVSPFRRCVLQTAGPDVVWVVRDDGILCGMTVQGNERIAGWHRHKIGGEDAKIIDAAVLPRDGDSDQLFVVTERMVGGVMRRAVEVMADDVFFPDPEDFYTLATARVIDRDSYRGAVYRRQEQYIHMDAAASYDGSARGEIAGATLTPAAGGVTLGASVVFTASAAVFAATDVGMELWKKPTRATGAGSGRATITGCPDTTHVTATITEVFDSVAAVPAGDWYFAADEISGLWHLEGEVVSVVADGAVIADGYSPSRGSYAVHTVANGTITLAANAAVVHVGLPYEGLLQTQNLEIGGRTGPAQTKPRNIVEFGIRFLNSLGCEYGTDLYNTEQIVHRDNTMETDRPAPVFSGIKKLPYSDTWSTVDSGNEKTIIVAQRLPLPCTVQFVDIQFETGDE